MEREREREREGETRRQKKEREIDCLKLTTENDVLQNERWEKE